MSRTATIILKSFASAAIFLSTFSAMAANVGDVVDLSPNLKGRVYSITSGTNNHVEVYANPDNKPTGALTIDYYYTAGEERYIADRLSSGAFASCGGLTSVSLPSSIEDIMSKSFERCGSLTEVNLSLIHIRRCRRIAF